MGASPGNPLDSSGTGGHLLRGLLGLCYGHLFSEPGYPGRGLLAEVSPEPLPDAAAVTDRVPCLRGDQVRPAVLQRLRDCRLDAQVKLRPCMLSASKRVQRMRCSELGAHRG